MVLTWSGTGRPCQSQRHYHAGHLPASDTPHLGGSAAPQLRRVSRFTPALHLARVSGVISRRVGCFLPVKLRPRNVLCCGMSTALFAFRAVMIVDGWNKEPPHVFQTVLFGMSGPRVVSHWC